MHSLCFNKFISDHSVKNGRILSNVLGEYIDFYICGYAIWLNVSRSRSCIPGNYTSYFMKITNYTKDIYNNSKLINDIDNCELFIMFEYFDSIYYNGYHSTVYYTGHNLTT